MGYDDQKLNKKKFKKSLYEVGNEPTTSRTTTPALCRCATDPHFSTEVEKVVYSLEACRSERSLNHRKSLGAQRGAHTRIEPLFISEMDSP